MRPAGSRLTLTVLTGLAVYACYLLVRPFLPALAWALAFAILVGPVHARLRRALRLPNLAAGLSVALVFLVLVLPSMFAADAIARQVGATLHLLTDEGASERLQATLQEHPAVAGAFAWIDARVDVEDTLHRFLATLAAPLANLVADSVQVALQMLIALFSLFFFLRDRDEVLHATRWLLPLTQTEMDRMFRRVTDTIDATIFGTVAVGLVQGSLGALIFEVLRVPGALLWGLVMAIVAVVPVLGAFVIWLPVAVWFAMEGEWGRAAILTGWGSVVIGLIDNLLYPVLVGSRMRFHTLPVLFALGGGLALFGASGIILGPVVLAVTVALFDLWNDRAAHVAAPPS